jgi:hypothetical protein
MFGKKKEEGKGKVKEPTRRELLVGRIASEVEQLTPGQSLIYKLPKFYWGAFGAFLIAELNPTYPQEGKKYCIYTDKIADDKPTDKKVSMGQMDKPKQIAEWIADRDNIQGLIERYQ